MIQLMTVSLAACYDQAPVDSSGPDEPPGISGLANVIDGDSLEVDGVSIRLFRHRYFRVGAIL